HGDGSGLRLSIPQQFINAGERAATELSCYCGCASVVVVNDADEFDLTFLGEVAVDARVVASEGAHADCGGFEWSCQLRVPSSQFKSVGGNRDSRAVGGVDDLFAIEQKAFAGVNGEAGCAGGGHSFDGFHSDGGDIKAHVLVGLRDFYDGEGAGKRRCGIGKRAHHRAGALDDRIRAFHSFHCNTSAFGDHHGLADVVMRDVASDIASVSDVLLLVFSRSAFGQNTAFCEQRLEELGRAHEVYAFIFEDLRYCADE